MGIAKLTAKEINVLLESGKKILTYKLMQSVGYQKLTKRAADERIRRLLAEISASEFSDAESWAETIEQLAGGGNKSGKVPLWSDEIV